MAWRTESPVNGRFLSVLLLAAVVLGLGVLFRGAEYDEQYTLFLTGGVVRPTWPVTPVSVASIRALQAPAMGWLAIADGLRGSDVHPPVYFWLVSGWRRALGEDLAIARMFSVTCALGSLLLTGMLANRVRAPVLPAVLLTLGTYGFVYTGVIARGYALAMLLGLGGSMLLARERPPGVGRGIAAGALFGAASCTSYLAVFPALGFAAGQAVTWWRRSQSWPAPRPADPCERVGGQCDPSVGGRAVPSPHRRPRTTPGLIAIALGAAPFLAVDMWFFLAQRASRCGQFAPFDPLPALVRLARYQSAALFGGLPLYVPEPVGTITAVALAVLITILLALVAGWLPSGRTLPLAPALAGGAVAPALGLLTLGAGFGTTPIELRYLAAGLPFAMILLAGRLTTLPPRIARTLTAAILTIQTASIAGLIWHPATQQPARRIAAAIMAEPDTLILVPRGNDGVGIVGAFAREASPTATLLIVGPGLSEAAIAARLIGHDRVIVADMAQDDASRAALSHIGQTLVEPAWHRVAARGGAMVYQRPARQYEIGVSSTGTQRAFFTTDR